MLWDVDGTLLTTSGIAQRAFDLAAAHVLGRPPGDHAVAMSGKTDPGIALEILAFAGVAADEARRRVPEVLARLEWELADATDRVRSEGRTHAGVESLLARLHAEPSVLQSALTGNTRANAAVKLAAFGLDRWLDLDVGAYGSDHHDREMLVPLALRRAKSLRGRSFDPDQVWVVGDTPRDLACARAAGARCVLVATGRFSFHELQAADADHTLADLADTDAVLDLLLHA
ncbi:MAG: HAD hydrolase-like protein [Acidimicrobiales bacterium]